MTQTRFQQHRTGVRSDRSLVLFSLCFALGCVAGAWFCRAGIPLQWQGFESGGDGTEIRFFSAWLRAARFLIVLCCCGFMRHGRGLALLMLACRGFLMSFTVASLVLSCGTAGYFLAFALLLVHGIALLPLTFHVALYSVQRWDGRRLHPRGMNGEDRLVAAVILLATCACAAADCLLTPALLRWVTQLFGL